MPKLFDTRLVTIKCDSKSTLRFNIGNNAHFITHYDTELLSRIINDLKGGKLQPIDRLQILNEQIILASAGLTNSNELVKLLLTFKNKTVESVWDMVNMAIKDLRKFVISNEEAESNLRTLVGQLAHKEYVRLGWNTKKDEPETDTKMRGTILGMMLFSENLSVISTAINQFHLNSIEKLNSELRGIILTAEVRYENDMSAINSMLEVYEKTGSAELKQSICGALTSTQNPKVITKLLGLIKNTSVVRTQDTARWIIYLMQNKYSKTRTWKWFRDNWGWIENTFGGDKSYDDFPRYAASALTTQKQLDEYRDFFEPMLTNPTLKRVIEMGISEITNRVFLIRRDGKAVRKTLSDL